VLIGPKETLPWSDLLHFLSATVEVHMILFGAPTILGDLQLHPTSGATKRITLFGGSDSLIVLTL
jgi:hypothetical protein